MSNKSTLLEGVYVLCQSILAELTSNSGLLEAAERNLSVERVRAVDPGRSGMQPVCNAQGPVDALAEDGGGETVVRVVRLPDDVVLVVELDNDTDGAEDLLAHDLHVGLCLGEDGGLDEEAFGAVALAAEVDLCALLFARVDVVHDALYDEQ